jgi:Uma2 family endonuclease
MSALPKHRMTPEEYLAMERASTERHEFINGEIYLMVGGSYNHSRIAANATSSLIIQLRTSHCEVVQSDMRVSVRATGLYSYPDVSVICGKPEFDDSIKDTLLNPNLIVEVLSPSTEKYDRGDKFRHYQRIASLQCYVLIAQNHPRIEAYTRQGNDLWLYSVAEGLESSLELPAVGCTLSLADVYEKVTFDEAEDRDHEPQG